jgi:hypothetical protein
MMALEAELMTLAATGSNALIAAMATDAWGAVRSGFARLLGRGEPEHTAAFEHKLEEINAKLEQLEGATRQRAATDQEAAWRTALTELLTEQPQAAASLTELLVQAGVSMPQQPGPSVVQHVVAAGDAQQAVLGSGTQSVTFGAKQR